MTAQVSTTDCKSLRELSLKVGYRSDENNLIDDFYVPCLRRSVLYQRAVGYFTSASLAAAAKGLAAFVHNNGKMQLVASPWFDEADIEAIRRGYESRDRVLDRALTRQIEDVSDELTRNRFECLAWLVSTGQLEIKIALCNDTNGQIRQGLYHEKLGIFTDHEGNRVAFSGSSNETIGGLVSNFEAIDVFWSWDDPHERAAKKMLDFEALWDDSTKTLQVVDFPDAAQKKLISCAPATPPNLEAERELTQSATHGDGMASTPAIPNHIELRDYQQEAIEAWFNHQCRGMLEMATGSGKTITALSAAVELLSDCSDLLIIITCPYTHLVDQWHEEAREFGFKPVQVYKSRSRWEPQLQDKLLQLQLGYRNQVSLITTHATFTSEVFQKTLSRYSGKILLIADEAHHLGAEHSRSQLPDRVEFRLGLSATPTRWFDEEGTEALSEYFGGTAFEFSLGDAIGRCLTPYYYYPHLVELNDVEFEEYEHISEKIGKIFSMKDRSPENDEALNKLLIKRSRILNNAENKINVLADLIDEHKASLSHALFYCASGAGQIEEVTRLLGMEKRLLVHPFTYRESNKERAELLEQFAAGKLHGLVAMNCLDEGVDVPNTQTAYILASSGNPRQFIQRRGRILRQAPGKDYAIIHDLITVGSKEPVEGQAFDIERRLLRKELYRFKEFAELSKNESEANSVIWQLAKAYRLLDF